MRKLEIELHQFETRSNPSRIDQLIHSTFIEIGYSGTIYYKNDILNFISTELKPAYTVWSQDYQFIELSKNIVQIIYKEARMDEKGVLSRHAIRTSIWIKESDYWRVKFHQATPITGFVKSKN